MENKKIKMELYHDNFQNYKRYNIPKAQLVIADIPYNLGVNAYASNPTWYVGGTTLKGKAMLPLNRSLIVTDSLKSLNISTSAISS